MSNIYRNISGLALAGILNKHVNLRLTNSLFGRLKPCLRTGGEIYYSLDDPELVAFLNTYNYARDEVLNSNQYVLAPCQNNALQSNISLSPLQSILKSGMIVIMDGNTFMNLGADKFS